MSADPQLSYCAASNLASKRLCEKFLDLWHVKETRDECEAVTEKID
jgi:hypothetical protein